MSICKVVLDKNGDRASFGLKAKRDIPASVFIKEACSSMSADLFEGEGPSVILANATQSGPQGPRIILGPFRLINHDCNPNAQVSRKLLALFSNPGSPIKWDLCRYIPFPRRMRSAL